MYYSYYTEYLQLERGPVDSGRERANGNLHGAVHEAVAHHEEGQELRQHLVRPGPHDHGMSGADAVELRHGQLSLIGPAAAKDDVALPEPELRARDIAALSPAPDVQALRVQMLQPHINLLLRILRLRPLADALRKRPKRHALPPRAVKERERGPGGVGLESLGIFHHEFHEWARMQIRLESPGFSTFVIIRFIRGLKVGVAVILGRVSPAARWRLRGVVRPRRGAAREWAVAMRGDRKRRCGGLRRSLPRGLVSVAGERPQNARQK